MLIFFIKKKSWIRIIKQLSTKHRNRSRDDLKIWSKSEWFENIWIYLKKETSNSESGWFENISTYIFEEKKKKNIQIKWGWFWNSMLTPFPGIMGGHANIYSGRLSQFVCLSVCSLLAVMVYQHGSSSTKIFKDNT